MAEQEISAIEDLMREHGVLNRVLLVYDESVRRIRSGRELPREAVLGGARLVREFIQDYHERLEEEWVFPRFREAGREVDLVDVLTDQHRQGRLLTDAILYWTQAAAFSDPRSGAQLAQACSLFTRMYRPHGAREDTVLYPELHDLLSKAEFDALGEQFEQEERRRFGEEGFERAVAAVAQLERMLGIYDLARFTP